MNDTAKPPLPEYVPPHPNFKGKAKVLSTPAHVSKNLGGPSYQVDLGAGTCTCKYGAPFQWHFKNQKWVPNQACSHKIRMMADILEKHDRPTDMQIAYSKQVAMRYNMYEAVSAFHKELRRGNVEQAVFWGHVLAYSRRVDGVIKYLLNILFEETREYWLGEWLLQAYVDPKADKYTSMLYGIALFCKSPKKWELPHRLPILLDEMRGYFALVTKYGRDVAKAGDIIAVSEREKLMAMLKSAAAKRGVKTGQHLEDFQFALKGLQKSKCANIDAHRAWILNELMRFMLNKNGARLADYIQKRADAGLGIGYHELNAFADLVMGEKYNAWELPDWAEKIRFADPPKLRLGVVPVVPIYAQDNHTWAGKALIRQYPNEWQAGAKQEHYDLRLCGAYMGVVWRHLAVKQHGRIDCEWHEVEWPRWLHQTVSNLWY